MRMFLYSYILIRAIHHVNCAAVIYLFIYTLFKVGNRRVRVSTRLGKYLKFSQDGMIREQCVFVFVMGGKCVIALFVMGGECVIALFVMGGKCVIALFVMGGKCVIALFVMGGKCVIALFVMGGKCVIALFVMGGKCVIALFVMGGSVIDLVRNGW